MAQHTKILTGSPDYTKVSVDTAMRVANQLEKRVTTFPLDFRLQGSVPLNVHIRGVSDVDLLTLIDEQFFIYDRTGVKALAGAYFPSALSSLQQLKDLRAEEEPALEAAFPKANVDKSGSKAIKISGGSLPRSVDVVPSHWFDTAAYQRSGAIHDRGVIILDRKANQTVENYPFKHIELVSMRDATVQGSLKKAIRLCKNVKSDADGDIPLPSFDIAAVMFHADQAVLRRGAVYELAILAETQRHLDYLHGHQEEAKQLEVPDGTRRIFDTQQKLDGLLYLSIEMDALLKAVALEHIGLRREISNVEARQVLSSIFV
jgi:hypothetical protein